MLSSGVDSIIIEPGSYPTEFGKKGIAASDQPRMQAYAPLLAQMTTLSASILGQR